MTKTNSRSKGLFYNITNALQKSGDIALAYAFQREEMRRNLLSREEREQLIEEITERVLSRIQITLDITSLRNASKEIEDLFRKFE